MIHKKETSRPASASKIDTNFSYAIVAGWLIFPAIGVIFMLINSFNISLLSYPVAFTQDIYYTFSYVMNILFIPFYVYILFTWFRRKRLLPKLMMINYAVNIIWSLIFIVYSGIIGNEWMYILVYAIWFGYFKKSKRVEQTFVR